MRQGFRPLVKKIFKIRLFVSTEYTNVTDGRTPHNGIGRAYPYSIASHSRNVITCILWL